MNIPPHPTWPADAAEAIALQKDMAGRVRLDDRYDRLETVAGIDCSYDIQNDISFAVVTIMRLDALKPLETVRAQMPTGFPYIPGLLSFREIPVILEALKQLPELPDLLMVDGQGVAHPRRLGIAAHLGVLLDWPAVGVAKSRLTGHYKEPGPRRGDRSPLLDKGERIGTVLRSREKVKPLFISPGHRVSHDAAVDLTLRCLIRHRLPEPTRIADRLSKEKPSAAPLIA
ncbi:MAG: deoxyribonuclease V [Bdellovibrionales bacterium]